MWICLTLSYLSYGNYTQTVVLNKAVLVSTHLFVRAPKILRGEWSTVPTVDKANYVYSSNLSHTQRHMHTNMSACSTQLTQRAFIDSHVL